MRILAVDDDPDLRVFFSAALRAEGHEAEVLSSGEEALAALRRAHAPVALVNWEMPEMTGVELCRRIRDRRHQPYVYVVLVTARSRRDDYLEAMDAGADDFLTKPIDLALLRARLRVAQRVLALQQALASRGGLVHVCSYCAKIEQRGGEWVALEQLLQQRGGLTFTHGACPACYQVQRAALAELPDQQGPSSDRQAGSSSSDSSE